MAIKSDLGVEREAFVAAREWHRILCDQLPEPDSDECERNEFLARVDDLVAALRELWSKLSMSAEYDSVKYEWLSRTASEWQQTLESRFQVRRPIRREIGVAKLPETDHSLRIFSVNEITAFLHAKAFSHSQSRKLARLLWQVAEFRDHPMRIHASIPSTPDEMERDWYEACKLFAWLVLQGRVHIAFQLDPAALEFLEDVWLHDVKRLSAYLQWENESAEFNTPRCDRYYLNACDALHEMYADLAIKVSPWHFDEIACRVSERYLVDGRIDIGVKPAARQLIESKARRLWQQTGRDDAPANWAAAETFVKLFYENIIAAVQEQKPDAVDAVVRAFRRPDAPGEVGCELLNAFEAAVAIFFVPAEAALAGGQDGASYL